KERAGINFIDHPLLPPGRVLCSISFIHHFPSLSLYLLLHPQSAGRTAYKRFPALEVLPAIERSDIMEKHGMPSEVLPGEPASPVVLPVKGCFPSFFWLLPP